MCDVNVFEFVSDVLDLSTSNALYLVTTFKSSFVDALEKVPSFLVSLRGEARRLSESSVV